MILQTLLLLCIFMLVNFIPALLITSPNRYNYVQSIIFGTLFFGIWIYKIKSDLAFQEARKMDLQESVYKKSHKAKYREILSYHDPSLFVVVDNNSIENDELMQRDFSALLMRILTVDAFVVLFFNYRGFKKVRPYKKYYQKKILLYSVFVAFCIAVEFFNYYLLY